MFLFGETATHGNNFDAMGSAPDSFSSPLCDLPISRALVSAKSSYYGRLNNGCSDLDSVRQDTSAMNQLLTFRWSGILVLLKS